MRIFKTIGIVGSIAVIMFSATIVSAKEQATSTPRERMQTVREEAKVRLEAQREQAKQRVAAIKDKVKQQKAQRLATQFGNLNKTWTDHFMNLLERYGVILQKMQVRADIAAGNGKDVTAVNTAIQSAKTAIATAQSSVTAQAAKTYTPDTTTSSSDDDVITKELRTSFKNLHKSLFADLFALRDGAMKGARKAVHEALQSLGNIKRVDDDSTVGEATTTESESNQ